MTLIELLAAGVVAIVVGFAAAVVLAWLVRLVWQELCDWRDRGAWRPARPGDTPGTVEPDDAPAPVYIARSPYVRHGSDEYASLTPGYEAKHRDTGIRTPASSPIVWADTALMEPIPDGPITKEFRGITGLDPDVPVLRTRTLRPEGNPQASWAQQALDLADMEA